MNVEYGTIKSYLFGFILCIALTLAAYFSSSDFAIATFALIQALVQLILFLNLTREAKPRWNLIIFLFMALIAVILVFGSLWIMNNINYNLMVS